jgi:hypothetical protein
LALSASSLTGPLLVAAVVGYPPNHLNPQFKTAVIGFYSPKWIFPMTIALKQGLDPLAFWPTTVSNHRKTNKLRRL